MGCPEFLKDVTIVTTDKKQIPVHMIVLYASSHFFKQYVKTKGRVARRLWVPYTNEEFQQLLDLFYIGKVTVQAKNLEKFLDMMKTFEVDQVHTENLCDETNQMQKDEELITQEPNNETRVSEGRQRIVLDEDLQDILDEVLHKVLQNSELREVMEDLLSKVVDKVKM